MIVRALMENTTDDSGLHAEHGLSLYIETERHKLLFDAGATALFAENASALGVDLSKVDIAILSHGHYDHSGGIERFLEINAHAPVYVSRYAFEPYYSGDERYIGVDAALAGNKRLIPTGDHLKIDDELELFSCNQEARRFVADTFGLNMQIDGALAPDDFRHEQYLLIRERGKRVLISGCSHKGILNIMDWFEPDVLIGGFHFMNIDALAEKDALLRSARALSEYTAMYYTCHCTGVEQFAVMKEAMGERLEYVSCGMTLEV